MSHAVAREPRHIKEIEAYRDKRNEVETRKGLLKCEKEHITFNEHQNEKKLDHQKIIKDALVNIQEWNAIKDDKEKSHDFLYNILYSFEVAVDIPLITPYKLENVRYLMNNPEKIIYKDLNNKIPRTYVNDVFKS